MNTRLQHSSISLIFYVVDISESTGTLTIPEGDIWVDGVAYPLSAETHFVGTAPFRLYVEKDGDGAGYLLDLTGEAQPTPFREAGAGVVAPLVCWRDQEDGPMFRLRHIQ
jgi:hypothetical protein